jgi:hypothetical protein
MSTTAVLLDIEEVFDTPWHLGLLYKLSKLKCSISLISLLAPFFLRENSRVLVADKMSTSRDIRGLTIKFTNSPPHACRGSSGQKPQYGLMTLTYQRFTPVMLLIYGSLFLSGAYYCLSVFWCAIPRFLNVARVEEKSERC